MERRVLLAITLSFLVLFLFQRFVMPPPRPANQSATAVAPGTTPAPGTPAPAPAPQAPSALQAPTASASAAATPANATPAGPTMTVGDVSAREIVVETSKVRAVFSNRGGTILH